MPESIPRAPLAVLVWLDKNAVQVIFQELKPTDRQKNRVILQYRTPWDNDMHAVGAANLPAAVFKAATRIDAERIGRQATWDRQIEQRNEAVARERDKAA